MKKILTLVITYVVILAILAGCSVNTYKSYTFTVDTGDKVKVSLDTGDNYDITSKVPFAISRDGKTLSEGTFILAETFEQYKDVVESDEKAKLLDSGKKDGIEYIFWSYNGTEFNYAILVEKSKTGIILGNAVSEESAKECFARLTITLVK